MCPLELEINEKCSIMRMCTRKIIPPTKECDRRAGPIELHSPTHVEHRLGSYIAKILFAWILLRQETLRRQIACHHSRSNKAGTKICTLVPRKHTCCKEMSRHSPTTVFEARSRTATPNDNRQPDSDDDDDDDDDDERTNDKRQRNLSQLSIKCVNVSDSDKIAKEALPFGHLGHDGWMLSDGLPTLELYDTSIVMKQALTLSGKAKCSW